MQSQSYDIPLYKQLRTTKPERSWSISQNQVKEYNWTLERCIEAAKQFSTREQWEKGCPASYQKAMKRGWLIKCTTHIKGFKRKATVPAKWTLDQCLEAGKKCRARTEFKKRFQYAYEKARLNGWLEICCDHMK
jgi:hypothetical protein